LWCYFDDYGRVTPTVTGRLHCGCAGGGTCKCHEKVTPTVTGRLHCG